MSKQVKITNCQTLIARNQVRISSSKARIAQYESKIDELKRVFEIMKMTKFEMKYKEKALRSLLNDSDSSWTGNL